MNEADILYDCINGEIDDERVLDWVNKLHTLADPNADRIRKLERELKDRIGSAQVVSEGYARQKTEIQELKNQVAQTELFESMALKKVLQLESQLAESVAKSEIEAIFSKPRESECPFPCAADNEDCQTWDSGYCACLDDFEKLLTSHKE